MFIFLSPIILLLSYGHIQPPPHVCASRDLFILATWFRFCIVLVIFFVAFPGLLSRPFSQYLSRNRAVANLFHYLKYFFKLRGE